MYEYSCLCLHVCMYGLCVYVYVYLYGGKGIDAGLNMLAATRRMFSVLSHSDIPLDADSLPQPEPPIFSGMQEPVSPKDLSVPTPLQYEL